MKLTFNNAIVLTCVLLCSLIQIGYSGSTAPIYGEDSKPVGLTMESQQIIVGILIIMIFVCMAFEWATPEVVLLTALIITLLLQILTLPEALSGFSNQSMITIGALFIVVGGVEKSHVVDWMARKTFGSDGSEIMGKFRMYCTCFLLSIFFNNTPLVAILLPVVKDWGRMRNIAASQLLMPLSYSVLAGSFISMIGTSTNLTVQGLMQADRGYSFSFFAPAPFGIICFMGLITYQIFAGPHLLPNEKVGLIRTARDKAASMMAEVYVAPGSKAAGKSVGEVMTSLGVAPTCIIKIRRRLGAQSGISAFASVDNVRASEGAEKAASTASRLGGNILDLSYLKAHSKAWTSTGAQRNANSPPSIEEAVDSAEAHNAESPDSTPLDFKDIIAPAYHELVAPHDVLFVSSAQDIVEKMMKSIAGESKGLFILNSNALALPGFGTELVECVVSDTNPFLGMKVSEFSGQFADKYHAGLITVRGKDWFDEAPSAPSSPEVITSDAEDMERGGAVEMVPTNGKRDHAYTAMDNTHHIDNVSDDYEVSHETMDNGLISSEQAGRHSGSGAELSEEAAGPTSFLAANPSITVSDHVLGYGDIILCVSQSAEVEKMQHNRDFFVVSTVGSLPKPLDFYKCIPVAIFIAMLIIVATENIDMCSASLTVAVVFLLGGWVKTNEIPDLVNVKLLMLIGSSISFAKAVTTSGLALSVAQTISKSNASPLGMLFLIYAITLAITELISNNAAAALMYPIAVALADEMGASFKPFAMCVLVASTACFMSPIGYQTHMMVWAPGGYKFNNFVKFGLVPDVIYWVLTCLLLPVIFPF